MFCAIGSAQVARAQPAPENTAAQNVADAGQQDASAPVAVRVPLLRVAAAERPNAGTDGAPSLDVAVVIDAGGRATLDEPLEPATLREAVLQSLAHSEFRPALRAGQPVAARVRLRMSYQPQPGAAKPEPPPPSESTPPPAEKPAESVPIITPVAPAQTALTLREPDLLYGASGRVGALAATVRRMQPQETRDLPGSFGDPFRVVDTLPGVVPALSGLPYVYVRGAPPAGTVYYYDGIQVPALFHLALGPAVVHPSLIDEIDFYASVAPARYGRFTGGVLSGGPTPRPPPSAANAELELRVIDVMGRVELPLAGGSLSVSGRYGYPGPVVKLFSPESTLDYWDYQTRLVLPTDAHGRFELVWFGSYDRAGFRDSRGRLSTFAFEFHRIEARLIRQLGGLELGSALQLGYEHSRIDTGLRVRAVRIGPRLYASYKTASGIRLRFGADMFGTVGDLYAPPNPDEGPIQVRVPVADDVAARSMMGAYAELSVPLWERLRVDLGVRGDLWLTGSRGEAAVDPRLTLVYRSHPSVHWHAAVGTGHQPAVFLIPLPGIADVGLEHGLQGAIQSEAGVAFDLPLELRLEVQGYLQRFTDMIFPELALDQTSDCASLPTQVADATPRCVGAYPRASAWAYGGELFLRRSPTEALSGWLSYTLGRASADSDDGEHFTPTFDVRHVLNLVLQYRFGGGFSAGTRLQYRSGKMARYVFVREATIPHYQRLPGFFRADLQFSYGWNPSWGNLRVSLEWFNVTLSREATDIECRDGVGVGADPIKGATPCTEVIAPALFFPNLGVRAEF